MKGLLRGRLLAAPWTLDFCNMAPSLGGCGGPPGTWPLSGPSSLSLRSDRSLLLLDSESRFEDWPLSSRVNFWDWFCSKDTGASSIPPGPVLPNMGQPEVDEGISATSCSPFVTVPSLCNLCDEAGAGEDEELGDAAAESAGKGDDRIPLGGSAMVNRFGFVSEAGPRVCGSAPVRPAKEVWEVLSPYAKNGLAGSLEACRKRFWWLSEVLKPDCSPEPPTEVPLLLLFLEVL